MNYFLTLILLSFSPLCSASGFLLDQRINQTLQPVSVLFTNIIFYSISLQGIDIPLIVIWLIAAALIFTFYFGFINIHGLKHSLKVTRGDFAKPDDPGEVTHFQALTTALSGTIGLGNIAGVAIAISIGGPGASLWMMLAGFLAMSTKFLECSLGVKYRKISDNGKVLGGPMYYLRDGLSELGLHRFGKFLALFFALCCVTASLCGSNMLQSNQAYQQFASVMSVHGSYWSDKGWLFGLILSLLIGAVIIGGIKSIGRITSTVVPLMAGIYLAAAIFILLSHASDIPRAFTLIFSNALNPEGITGGMIGVMIQGFKRSAFSNESGIGAASIAHSAAATSEHIREGYVALLEPFIDTVVICTMTALVIIITGEYTAVNGIDGVTMTSRAFARIIWWFPYVLSVAVLLFAISTMISWAYYGSIAWSFLVGDDKRLDLVYKFLFCLATIIGASTSLDSVIAISDSMFFSMAIANIAGLYLLAPMIKLDLQLYRNKYA